MKQFKFICWVLPILVAITVIPPSYAQNIIGQKIFDATIEFEQGRYPSVLEILEQTSPTDPKMRGAKAYLMGLAHNKLQNYDLATKHFKTANQYKHPARDLYYEWGQALYANNQLEKARSIFKKSYHASYKSSESLYYTAYISQLLMEHRDAIQNYRKLIKTDREDPSLRQVARFQMAQSIFTLSESLSKERRKKLIDKTVLPLLRLALKTDPDGQAYKDIQLRVNELQDQFGLDPNKMVNGRRISPQKWKVYAAQRLKFDDNITLANDQPTVTITQQDSYISESVLDVSYESIFQREFALEYALRLQNIHHHDRSTPEVYSNDRYILTPTIKGTWEHKVAGKMASTEVSLSYDYTGQDADAKKENSFFSRSFNIGLAERIRILPYGDTVFKLKIKRYRNRLENQHFNSVGFGVDQIAILPNNHLLVALLNYTDIDNFNNTLASTASIILRTDYIMTRVMPKVDLTFSLTFNALDTKEQSDQRGTEKTFTPSIKISRKITDSLRLSLEHSITNRSSLDEAKEYDKNVTNFELRYMY